MPALLAYVGYWGKTGKHLLVLSFTGFDPIADIGAADPKDLPGSPQQADRAVD
jgi:hypothetical protein